MAEKALDANGELDLTFGRQLGYDANYSEIDQITPYIKNPPRIIVTRAPGGFDYLDDPAKHKKILVELLERGAKTFTGFTINTDIGTHQVPLGLDGQAFTAVTTRIRQQITPSATFDPVYNAQDIKWWKFFLDTLIAHPSTGKPNFAAMSRQPTSWTATDYTFDFLVYEPNAVGDGAVWAMTCVGAILTTDVEVLLDRNVAELRTAGEYSLTFPCVYNDSEAVLAEASAIERMMKASTINPNLRPASTVEISVDLQEINAGILNEVNKAAAEYLV